MSSVFGFLCEYDDDILKLFDFKHRKLMSFPNPHSEDVQLNLAERYKYDPTKSFPLKKADHRRNENIIPYLQEGYVLVYTWAVSPNPIVLPDEILEKYEDKLWSQFLGLVDDPQKMYCTKFRGGEKGWITVKYAPKEDTLFDVVGVHDPKDDGLLNHPTPWELEAEGVQLDAPPRHMSEMVANKFNKITEYIEHALCIDTDCPNLAKNSAKNPRTKNKCHLLFNMKYGLIRWLPENMEDGQAGHWYKHKIADKRKLSEYAGKETYYTCTARLVEEIISPLPTRMNKGDMQFLVDFVFDQNALELEENRKIKDWNERYDLLKKDAHFWNQYLGKVEIYPKESREIIQVIENYKKYLAKRHTKIEDPEPQFTVSVKVHRLIDYFRNSHNYPQFGLFKVKSVMKIKYGEKLIFDNCYGD